MRVRDRGTSHVTLRWLLLLFRRRPYHPAGVAARDTRSLVSPSGQVSIRAVLLDPTTTPASRTNTIFQRGSTLLLLLLCCLLLCSLLKISSPLELLLMVLSISNGARDRGV